MNTKKFVVSPGRAQKSAYTKQHIIDVTTNLLKAYSYEQLTVRNICAAAGVSNGTFYNLFESKDDLLGYYLRQAQNNFSVDSEDVGLLEYIIAGYDNLTKSYKEMGIEFISGYYTPKNQAFNIYTRKKDAGNNYVRDLYYDKLSEAQYDGYITQAYTIDQIAHDIQVIVIGCTFQWCATNGLGSLEHEISRMLRQLLEPLFTEKYYKKYPKNRSK